MPAPLPRLYGDLASWWPLFSPPIYYVEEAEDLLSRLEAVSVVDGAGTLLELGSGGGSVAFHLKSRFRLTLTDISPGMLAHSQAINPECEHIVGDMRSLRLGRTFDVVLIHDAIMYLTDPSDVRAALETAAVHCRAGGTIAVLPDCVRETFAGGTEEGGDDAPDGRGLRYLSWTWDPDPKDDCYVVDYAYLLRAADGTVTAAYDRHEEGLFSRASWRGWLADAGFDAQAAIDAWGRDVFIGQRTGAR